MKNINEKLVSVVVPVYNAENYIKETISYVQSQTYPVWELILVDDKSTDKSCHIIEDIAKNDDRIQLIKQPQNCGVAAARNKGVMHAQGRYICFLDADDIWQEDKLQKQLDFMNQENAAFSYTGYEFADEYGKGLGKIVKVPGRITYKQALKNTTIFTSTVMIDRRYVQLDDIMMPHIASEDTATWWQILKKHQFGYGLDCNLVRYRRSANTLSSNKAVAVKRIWNLYRKQEKLSFVYSLYCMFFWAFRAVIRRI